MHKPKLVVTKLHAGRYRTELNGDRFYIVRRPNRYRGYVWIATSETTSQEYFGQTLAGITEDMQRAVHFTEVTNEQA